MSPHIVKSKTEQIASLLKDLRKYERISYQEFLDRSHYAVERLLELLVITASDALLHVLTLEGEDMPTTLRTTFLRAGEMNIIPQSLAKRLAEAASMRNLLVHAYAKIDLNVVYASIGPAIKDFSEFAELLAKRMGVA